MSHPLRRLHDLGQSFWWDQLSRGELRDGTVARMRDENGMRGMTSNPAIFQKAVADSDDYDAAIAELARRGQSTEEIFWTLAVEDIQAACEVLAPVHRESSGADGFVSLEVDPRLAHDSQGTLSQARELWNRVDRPNLMIKIPGTPEGVPAVRSALREGIHVNVTLLFAPTAHVEVMEAYLGALEDRAAGGLALDAVASVASFFVSRVDTTVDARLEAIGTERALALRGRAAIANAKVAYANFERLFGGPRFGALAARGARVQRPLWASTGVKNPAYSDVLYVEELVGPHTVNTMPTATAMAWRDHGAPRPASVREDLEGARALLAELESMGVSLGEITEELLADGVRKFEQAFEALLEAVRAKSKTLGARPN